MYNVRDYKINSIISPEYEGFDIQTIDFKRHLQPSIALEKVIEKGSNGRPIKAEYFYSGAKYAEIQFTFTTDTDNLLLTRKESLYYVLPDDSLGLEIVIKNKTYDHSIAGDGEIVVKERIQTRQAIVDSSKLTVVDTLENNLSYSMAQVLAEIKPFWDDYQQERWDFIELGASDWKDAVAAIDLGTTSYTWLNEVIPNTSTNLRDYIVSQLSY